MSKQVLIYDNVQPLTEKHLKWSVDTTDLGFTSHLSSVPVLAAEIPLVATDVPIIFSALAQEGEFMPLAMLGLKNGQNLLLDSDNRLMAHYVPGFFRRYPFILGGSTDSEMMVICIDEDSKACVPDGSRGYKLFEESGEQSQALKEVSEFLRDYHYKAELTKVFCRDLYQLGLLEPMKATVTLKDKTTFNLSDFYVINREKLKAISDEKALDLFKKDGLELIYAHLQSLSNINRLIEIASAGM